MSKRKAFLLLIVPSSFWGLICNSLDLGLPAAAIGGLTWGVTWYMLFGKAYKDGNDSKD